MDLALLDTVLAIAIPVVLLVSMAGYAYVNAPKHGMSPEKWAAISFFIPLFGFFAYLFEREERTRDPNDREMFTDGFEIHKSRADDISLNEPEESTKNEREL